MRIKDLLYYNMKERPYNIFIAFVCLIALLKEILTHFGLSYLKYRPGYEMNNIVFVLIGEIQSAGSHYLFYKSFLYYISKYYTDKRRDERSLTYTF